MTIISAPNKATKRVLDPKKTATYYSTNRGLAIQMKKHHETIIDGQKVVERGKVIKFNEGVFRTDNEEAIDYLDNLMAGAWGHVWSQIIRKAPTDETVRKAREIAISLRRKQQEFIKEANAERQVQETHDFETFVSRLKQQPRMVEGMRDVGKR